MQSPESYPGRAIAVNQILLPLAARDESGEGAVVDLTGFAALFLQLDVTAAATAAENTLDVYLQTAIDLTIWIDIYHFTQVFGNGGAKRYIGKVLFGDPMAEADVDDDLAAGDVRAIAGDQFRIRWAIVADDEPSFTFGVRCNAT